MSVIYSVGLIRGRHPLPVEEYLLPGPDLPWDTAHLEACTAALRWAQERGLFRGTAAGPGDTTVRLYITGLTRAVLGAIMGLIQAGLNVEVWEYNSQTGTYETGIRLRAYHTGVGPTEYAVLPELFAPATASA